MPTKVIMLPLSISNAYLLLGDWPVLIDAGAPKDGDRLVATLRQHSITPKDLSLIALTHGHTGAVAAVAADGARSRSVPPTRPSCNPAPTALFRRPARPAPECLPAWSTKTSSVACATPPPP